MEAHDNLLEDEGRIAELVRSAKRVVVLGIKTRERSDRPAYYVPQFLQQAGAEIVPVPVYHPEATEILGQKVYRKLADVPGPVDIVDVFRRARDIPPHLDDVLRLRPRAVWFQLGIRNDEAALRLAQEGVLVVQDRCLMVDWRKYRG